MRFDVLTLFPEMFDAVLGVGITRRAYAEGRVALRAWQIRDYALDNYRRVDDRPFGGGPGMVMLVEPLQRALAAAQADRVAAGLAPGRVIHFSPAGTPLTQARLQSLATAGQGAVLLCGRYEGIDQRVIDAHVDEEISLGDFVLSGGELPALALLDGVARLMPGVLNDAQSHQQDSHSDGLLDCPHYSRPELLAGDGMAAVPAVLLGGHHAQIQRWRRERQLEITARRRPDLIQRARAEGRLSRRDEDFLASLPL